MMLEIIAIILLILNQTLSSSWGLPQGQQVDLDKMRISNGGLNGFVNYHTAKPNLISPPPATPQSVDKLTNNIDKPIIPLPRASSKRPKQSANSRLRLTGATTVKPQMYPTHKLKNQQKPDTGPSPGIPVAPAAGGCDWILLRDFKNISLDVGELIVRDEDEQPCYLLSIRGFIRLNENAYFPLSSFQSHPRLHKFILTGSPNDGASVQRSSYLNCSLLTSDGNAPSPNLRYAPLLRLTIPFKEEIIVRVKCGYLVLQIHGDGFHLTLDSLSFYQDPDVFNINNNSHLQPLDVPQRATNPQIESEHQVFSSEPVNVVSPLLMMPLTSRYTCQNRVVLTGNNSVQLVLDNFELQRLALSPSRGVLDSPPSGSGGNNNNSSNQSDFVVQNDRRFKRQTGVSSSSLQRHSKTSAVRRITRDAHAKVNFPAVIRCPNPANPYDPLTSMMDLEFTHGLNETISKMIADRWMPAKSAANLSFYDSLAFPLNNQVWNIISKSTVNTPQRVNLRPILGYAMTIIPKIVIQLHLLELEASDYALAEILYFRNISGSSIQAAQNPHNSQISSQGFRCANLLTETNFLGN